MFLPIRGEDKFRTSLGVFLKNFSSTAIIFMREYAPWALSIHVCYILAAFIYVCVSVGEGGEGEGTIFCSISSHDFWYYFSGGWGGVV